MTEAKAGVMPFQPRYAWKRQGCPLTPGAFIYLIYYFGSTCGAEVLRQGIEPMPVSFFFFLSFAFSRAAPTVHGGSQARGLIGPVATGLFHSHSDVRSKPSL